jgi:hypothetical protein
MKFTQPPILWVPRVLYLWVKESGHEADLSSPSNAEVKNALSYTFTSPHVVVVWCLLKYRNNFTFYLFIYSLLQDVSNVYYKASNGGIIA